MRTRITELLGIRRPIIQGGMHYVGLAELASAVSNAGGLGILTALTQRTPELLAKEISRCRAMTDQSFGVNLTFLPTFTAPPYAEYIQAIIEGGVKVVETAVRSPEAHLPALQKAEAADGVDLINIVRGEEQVALLKGLGASRVVDSSAADFKDQLTREIGETRATIAFDAVGGGKMANILLHAMEASEARFSSSYSLYGTDSLKQVYVYGSLDVGETVLDRGYGFAWSVSAFLITNFLKKAGAETRKRLLSRIAREYDTTFASHFSAEIGLRDLLRPEILDKLVQKKTGDKYLLRFNI